MSKPVVKLPPEVMEYFPYSAARPHQDEFITTVNQAVNDRKSVLIEGSNGLGKTISALSAVSADCDEKEPQGSLRRPHPSPT